MALVTITPTLHTPSPAQCEGSSVWMALAKNIESFLFSSSQPMTVLFPQERQAVSIFSFIPSLMPQDSGSSYTHLSTPVGWKFHPRCGRLRILKLPSTACIAEVSHKKTLGEKSRGCHLFLHPAPRY